MIIFSCTNHFLNACDELSQHIALFFSAMLVHGCAVGDLVSCSLIPIPKGKNTNVTVSDNYRGIALSSVFGKIFDLIFLNKFSDCCIPLSSSSDLNLIIPLPCALWY